MRNTAMINRSDESRDIANDSAAEPDDERVSIQPGRNHLIANHAAVFERFRFLASRNRDQRRLKSRMLETLPDTFGVK